MTNITPCRFAGEAEERERAGREAATERVRVQAKLDLFLPLLQLLGCLLLLYN